MPIYEYHCDHHGKFELLRQLEDRDLGICPVCGGRAQKLLSPLAKNEFRSYWTDALSAGKEPVHVTSREQEQKLCQEMHCQRVS